MAVRLRQSDVHDINTRECRLDLFRLGVVHNHERSASLLERLVLRLIWEQVLCQSE